MIRENNARRFILLGFILCLVALGTSACGSDDTSGGNGAAGGDAAMGGSGSGGNAGDGGAGRLARRCAAQQNRPGAYSARH